MITVKSPLKMNDWNIKSFLIVVFSIQSAYFGTFAMNKFGIEVPFLRQIISFVYITFIPGYLLLRLLKIHKLSSLESFLYAVGLSLFFDMFVGFLMDISYPMFGITDKPMSEIPTIVTFTLAILLLSIWVYLRDKNYYNPDFINLKDILSPQLLSLSLVPFMAIFGTYLVNYYRMNILLMIMLTTIALIVLIIGFTDWISEKLYPYVVWIIALSLVLHITLITEYIPPLDAVGEYIVSRTTLINEIWDPFHTFTYKSDIPMFSLFHYNTSLVCGILWPIYSLILNLSLNEVYKIIGPSLYSFVALATYNIFLNFYRDHKEKFSNIRENKLAVISTLLVCTVMPFYRIIPLISKQSIAELFFVLILLSLFNTNSKLSQLLIFTSSMVISHYSSSFIYLVGFALGYMFLRLSLGGIRKKSLYLDISRQLEFIILFGGTFYVTWYLNISVYSVFKSLIMHINTIVQIIGTLKLFIFEFSRGAYILSKESGGICHKITKFLYLYVDFLIVVGVVGYILYQIKYIYTRREMNNKGKWYVYLGFSVYALGVLVATIIVPYFAVVDPRRLFHMFSYVIGVFYPLGLLYLVRIGLRKTSQITSYVKIASTIGVVLLLLFSSGFIYEITRDYPNSISLSYNSVNRSSNLQIIANFYVGYVEKLNVVSAQWLFKYHLEPQVYRFDVVEGDPEFTVYGGFIQEKIYVYHTSPDESTAVKESYLYLSYPVTKLKTAWEWNQLLQGIYPYRFPYFRILILHNKIYTNSGSEILWVPSS